MSQLLGKPQEVGQGDEMGSINLAGLIYQHQAVVYLLTLYCMASTAKGKLKGEALAVCGPREGGGGGVRD